MKKAGVLIFLVILLASPMLAQEDEGIDKAYTCLENEIANKTSDSLSLQEAVFSTLALGSKSKLTDKIEDEMSNQNCWPKSSCTIKDTAQVLLAYDRINKNTNDIESYLLSKNDSATDILWYLQIDISSHVPSECTITYGGSSHTINIGDDMKLSGGAGSCLTLSSSGYWLQVSRTCYNEIFQVSCDKDFITSLLYQKSGSETIYVSSETHSAASSGTTEEKVKSECFKTGSSCDYEGTLWAAVALQKVGKEVSSYLPYLLALAEDNQALFPGSFLYILTAGDDQYNEVVQAQKSSGFWEAPNTRYNKFYDTALGLLSLQGSSASEVETAKTYLLSVQTPKGCWNNNNIRDTAFLLYGGWSQAVSRGDGGSGLAEVSCAEAGFYCGSQFDCPEGGQIFAEYSCPGFQSCCSLPIIEQTCSDKNGVLCSLSQQCSGTEVSSVEGSCCLETCQPITSQVTECEEFNGFCLSSCSGNEKTAPYSCGNFGEVCCIAEEDSGGFGVWIVILIILIVLAVLGIVFRHKLQTLWFKLKNRKGSGSDREPSSSFSPRPPPRFPPAQRTAPIQRPPLISRPVKRAVSKVDREMEETLNKLKEMSR